MNKNLSANYKIEVAQESEISEITKLLNHAYKELADIGLNYTATYQNDEITKDRISPGRCFVMKDQGNKIVGTILMTFENYFTNHRTAYLGQFGICPELKGQGLGTFLINYCENLALLEGFVGMQLDTAIPAKHLVEWYLRLGYKIVGQKHFDGKNYDSFIFEKTLIKPWEKYYQVNKNKSARPLIVESLDYVLQSQKNHLNSVTKLTALDLGTGTGNEVIYLLNQGFHVTGVDILNDSKEIIYQQINEHQKTSFVFINSDFAKFDFLSKYDLVWSYLSLPFCNKNDFLKVVQNSIESVNDNGVFAGSFFGEMDEWVLNNKVNGLSKSQLESLFSDMIICHLIEKKEIRKSVMQNDKQWHYFEIIAKKK